MKILLSSILSPHDITGIGKYNGEFVRWFRDRGHQVDVLTTLPYYPYWEIYDDYKNEDFAVETSREGTIYSFRLPVSKEITSTRRVMIDLSFFLKTFYRLPYLAFQQKYDIILLVLPTLTGFPSAILGKFVGNAKLHVHVQDMQLETARELDLLPSPMLNILDKFEKLFLKSADFVSSISGSMVQQMGRKIKNPATELGVVTNWTDTAKIRPVDNHVWLKRKFGYSEDTFLVVYSGNIGEKQGIEQIFPAAKKLQDCPGIQILILGDGANRKKLIEKSESYRLPNVRFGNLVPEDKLNLMLNGSDVQLILQRKSAGDSFMPSKFINILSAGVPSVITARKDTELFTLATENHTSLVVEPEEPQKLVRAILKLRDEEELRETLSVNARNFALKAYRQDDILGELESYYESLIK